MSSEKRSCACSKCVAACSTVPGWFMPEEIAPAAAFLGLTVEEFAAKHLTVATGGIPYGRSIMADLFGGHEAKPVLRPRRTQGDPGGESLFWDHDIVYFRERYACSFQKEDGDCSIHPVKPRECREVFGCEESPNLRDEIEEAWEGAEDPTLRRLTGRETKT